MARPVMFLRTAQTEQRITDLEEKMSMVLTKLGMVPPSPSDEEWEQAAPKPEPIEWKEPDLKEPPKQSQPQKAKKRA